MSECLLKSIESNVAFHREARFTGTIVNSHQAESRTMKLYALTTQEQIPYEAITCIEGGVLQEKTCESGQVICRRMTTLLHQHQHTTHPEGTPSKSRYCHWI
jgi:hypothetical protein